MTLKVAIAGAGHIAAVHARAVKNQGGQLVAVIEKYADRATEFAQTFAIANQYATLGDLQPNRVPNFTQSEQS